MRSIFLSFMLCASISFAGVLDHVREIPQEDKLDVYSMRNIDFIYMINLKQRPEKYEHSIKQLHPYGIFPYRFFAINGWEDLTIEDINDMGVKYLPGMKGGYNATRYPVGGAPDGKETIFEVLNKYGEIYFVGCLTRGGIGCILSHLSIIKDAYDAGYETIWVMEDDVEVIKDPRQIPDLIDELDQIVGPDGWDVLYTDREHRNARGEGVPASGYPNRPNYTPTETQRLHYNYKVGEKFRRVGARFGTHSMIIRRSGMKKLLDFFKQYQLYHPIDVEMHAPKGMRLFTVTDDVVGNMTGWISDLGRPSYANQENN